MAPANRKMRKECPKFASRQLHHFEGTFKYNGKLEACQRFTVQIGEKLIPLTCTSKEIWRLPSQGRTIHRGCTATQHLKIQ
ncbi:hypothetical protein GDO78_017292 [Eleutherodactylus coqui]|uniref:Uncharacterized protein n=1 Tax=Eleutherodactylus coqui TaxID=57060 RepID=A0A8J6EP41_ELECQ|nr:hypothetical protein GDO78_017292 [Eleutherodactylus coqui]